MYNTRRMQTNLSIFIYRGKKKRSQWCFHHCLMKRNTIQVSDDSLHTVGTFCPTPICWWPTLVGGVLSIETQDVQPPDCKKPLIAIFIWISFVGRGIITMVRKKKSDITGSWKKRECSILAVDRCFRRGAHVHEIFRLEVGAI